MTSLVFLLLALALLGVGVILGALLINACNPEQPAQHAREAQLTALWRSLQASNRINAAFWRAHSAMREEAERQEAAQGNTDEPT